MRVALVTFAGSPDAPELLHPDGQVPALAQALSRRGDEVVVFLRDIRTDDQPDGVERTYRTVRLPAGPTTALTEADAIRHLGEYVAALGNELRTLRPDVVHSHCWLAGLATHLASRDDDTPVVHTFHRLQLERPRAEALPASGGQVRAERAVALHADRNIAVSRVEQDRLVRAGVPHQRISVVPCGVDAERLTPEGPVEHRGQPHRLVLFGSIRSAVPAVQALTALADAELVVVDTVRLAGQPDGDEIGRLRRYAAHLGVGDRFTVVTTPAAASVRRAELVRSAEAVLAYPDPHRGGHGHLEAMACGVPVVAGTPQAEESVVDGVTGIHASAANSRQLAKVLRRLLESGTMRQGMGLAGRDRATGRYGWTRIADETARVYEDVRQRVPSQPAAGPSVTDRITPVSS